MRVKIPLDNDKLLYYIIILLFPKILQDRSLSLCTARFVDEPTNPIKYLNEKIYTFISVSCVIETSRIKEQSHSTSFVLYDKCDEYVRTCGKHE